MSAHKEITSKQEFDDAIATQGKYVFIYAYEGEVSPQAEESVIPSPTTPKHPY